MRLFTLYNKDIIINNNIKIQCFEINKKKT